MIRKLIAPASRPARTPQVVDAVTDHVYLSDTDLPAAAKYGTGWWVDLLPAADRMSVGVKTIEQAVALNAASQKIVKEMRAEAKAKAALARRALNGDADRQMAERTETVQYICTADWGSATASQRCMLLAGHDGLHLDADDYKWGDGVLPTQRWVQIPAGTCGAWCTRPGSRQECTLAAGHDGAHLDVSGDEFGDPAPSSMQDKPAEWTCPECGAGLYRVDSGLCVSCDAKKSIAARKAMQDSAPVLRDLGSVASPNGAVGHAGQPPAELDSIGGRAPFAGLPAVPTWTCGRCGSHSTMPSHPECRRYYAGELRDTVTFRHAREALAGYEARRGTMTDEPGADEERRPAWQAGYLSQVLSSLLAEIEQRAGAGR